MKHIDLKYCLLVSVLLLTACGNSEESNESSVTNSSEQDNVISVENSEKRSDGRDKVISSKELDELIVGLDTTADIEPEGLSEENVIQENKTAKTDTDLTEAIIVGPTYSHDSLIKEEIGSHQGTIGNKCRSKAEEKFNLSMLGYSDNDAYKHAAYIGKNTYRLQSSSVISGTKDKVEFLCSAVASGDSSTPVWEITVRRIN